MSGKKRVIIRGPSLTASGYGEHCRQVGRYLIQRDDVDLVVAPTPWGITPWYIDRDVKDGLIGELMQRSRDDKGPFDLSVQVQLPNEWDPKLARANVGVTAGVETTTCNPSWVENVNAMHSVIVPSMFVKQMFQSSGTLRDGGTHVHVVPEACTDAIVGKRLAPAAFNFSTPFNFLVVGQLTGSSSENDRKNIFNTVKWVCEVFKDDPDVGLIVKTNSGRETKIDRKITSELMMSLVKQVRSGPYPRVYLVHGILSDEEMASLYAHDSVRAFVSLTRGEGFGLPILEAACSDVPVVVTNWSGHLDFMNKGRFVKLDFGLDEVPKSRIDSKIFIEGARWANVSEHDVKRKLRKLRDSPVIPGQWASALGATLREQHSFASVACLYDSVLGPLLC